MSSLESAIEAGEDRERDVNGAGSKEALKWLFLAGSVGSESTPSFRNEQV